MLAKLAWTVAVRAGAGVRAGILNAAHEIDAGGVGECGPCQKRDK